MARKKQFVVSDILNIMEESDKVCVILYAYGVYYGNTMNDGMNTVAECKDQMNYDCINALVTRIRCERTGTDVFAETHVVIQAEIVH